MELKDFVQDLYRLSSVVDHNADVFDLAYSRYKKRNRKRTIVGIIFAGLTISNLISLSAKAERLDKEIKELKAEKGD